MYRGKLESDSQGQEPGENINQNKIEKDSDWTVFRSKKSTQDSKRSTEAPETSKPKSKSHGSHPPKTTGTGNNRDNNSSKGLNTTQLLGQAPGLVSRKGKVKVVKTTVPTTIEDIVKKPEFIILHGFPKALETYHTEIDAIAGDILEQMDIRSLGEDGKMCLVDKGCFGMIYKIERRSTNVVYNNRRPMRSRAIPQIRYLQPRIGVTLLEAGPGQLIWEQKAKVLGVARGLEGSIEEVILRATTLQNYLQLEVDRRGIVVLGHLLQGYGTDPDAWVAGIKSTKWQHLNVGFVLVPEDLKIGIEEAKEKLMIQANERPKGRDWVQLPGALDMGVFKFEVYHELSALYNARFGQRALVEPNTLIEITGIKLDIPSKDVLLALQEDRHFSQGNIQVVFGTAEPGHQYKKIIVALKETEWGKEPGEKLKALGGKVTLVSATTTPGQQIMLEQRSAVVQEEKYSSPWVTLCGETITGGIDARNAGKPGGISYLGAVQNDFGRKVISLNYTTAVGKPQVQNQWEKKPTTEKHKPQNTTPPTQRTEAEEEEEEWEKAKTEEAYKSPFQEAGLAKLKSELTEMVKSEIGEAKKINNEILLQIRLLKAMIQEMGRNTEPIKTEGSKDASGKPASSSEGMGKKAKARACHQERLRAKVEAIEKSGGKLDALHSGIDLTGTDKTEPGSKDKEHQKPGKAEQVAKVLLRAENSNFNPMEPESDLVKRNIAEVTNNEKKTSEMDNAEEEPSAKRAGNIPHSDHGSSEVPQIFELTGMEEESSRCKRQSTVETVLTEGKEEILGHIQMTEGQLTGETETISELTQEEGAISSKRIKDIGRYFIAPTTEGATKVVEVDLRSQTEQLKEVAVVDDGHLVVIDLQTPPPPVPVEESRSDQTTIGSQKYVLDIGDTITPTERLEIVIPEDFWRSKSIAAPKDGKLTKQQAKVILRELSLKERSVEALIKEVELYKPREVIEEDIENLIQTQEEAAGATSKFWNPVQYYPEKETMEVEQEEQADQEVHTLIDDEMNSTENRGNWEDYDREDYTNFYRLRVQPSFYRATIAGEEKWNIRIGSGLINTGSHVIPAGKHILTFTGGTWITQHEANQRIMTGEGGYIMAARHNSHLLYDMRAARGKGELASAINSPANLRKPDQLTKAKANCKLTYSTKTKTFGITTTQNIKSGAELFYYYGNSFQLQIKDTMVTEGEIFSQQITPATIILWQDLIKLTATVGGYEMTLEKNCNELRPQLMVLLQDITSTTTIAEVRDILEKHALFNLKRDAETQIEDNVGAGHCGWATLFQAHLRTYPDKRVPTSLTSGSLLRKKKLFMDFMREYIQKEGQRYYTYGQDSTSKKEIIESANAAIAATTKYECLPRKYWLTGDNLVDWEPEVEKSVWWKQYDAEKEKDMETLMETTVREGVYFFDFEQLLIAERSVQIIFQVSAGHFVISRSQPRYNVINQLLENLTTYVYQRSVNPSPSI